MMRAPAVLIFSALAALIGTGGGASALTILARCGPSDGQSYYFEGGFIGPGKGGWQKDGFENGRIAILIDDKEKLDVIIRDLSGTRSYLAEGINVSAQSVNSETRSFIVTAAGRDFVETFLVKTNQFGVGSVVWTSAKNDAAFVKTSIMLAECGPKFEITK